MGHPSGCAISVTAANKGFGLFIIVITDIEAISNWASKVIRDFFVLLFPENSHHSLNQSDAKLKPIMNRSLAFSRALGSLVGFI